MTRTCLKEDVARAIAIVIMRARVSARAIHHLYCNGIVSDFDRNNSSNSNN